MSLLSAGEANALYSRYGPSVLNRCLQLLGDEAAAWDAMHETFVRAIRHAKSFQGKGSTLAWLQAIALRTCLDELSRRRRIELTPEIPGELLETESENVLEQSQNRQVVLRLLPRLKPAVQEIVVMRFFDELEVQEIARLTGSSERTVARRLAQFLVQSRRLLRRSA